MVVNVLLRAAMNDATGDMLFFHEEACDAHDRVIRRQLLDVLRYRKVRDDVWEMLDLRNRRREQAANIVPEEGAEKDMREKDKKSTTTRGCPSLDKGNVQGRWRQGKEKDRDGRSKLWGEIRSVVVSEEKVSVLR